MKLLSIMPERVVQGSYKNIFDFSFLNLLSITCLTSMDYDFLGLQVPGTQ